MEASQIPLFQPYYSNKHPKTYKHLQPVTQLSRKGQALAQTKLILPRDDAGVPVCPNTASHLPSPLLPAEMCLKLCRELDKSYIFCSSFFFFFWWWYFFKLTLLLLLFKSQENTWDNTENTSHKPTRKLQLLDWICVNNKDVHITGIQAARNFWVYLFLILTPLLLPIISIFPLYF